MFVNEYDYCVQFQIWSNCEYYHDYVNDYFFLDTDLSRHFLININKKEEKMEGVDQKYFHEKWNK